MQFSNHRPSVQVIRSLVAISMLGLASNAQLSAMILARRFQMPARSRVGVGKKSTARSWLLQMLVVCLVLTSLAQRNATRRSAQLIASCLSGRSSVLHTQLAKPKNGGLSCKTNVETGACNKVSCDRDCTLARWTPWTLCSVACRGGLQSRAKHVLIPSSHLDH